MHFFNAYNEMKEQKCEANTIIAYVDQCVADLVLSVDHYSYEREYGT